MPNLKTTPEMRVRLRELSYPAQDEYDRAVQWLLDDFEAELPRLEGLVYVPGVWRCAKCDFRLIQSNLNANTGTVTARDTPGDKCPNFGMGFTREHKDGRVEHIPPEQVMLYTRPNTQED